MRLLIVLTETVADNGEKKRSLMRLRHKKKSLTSKSGFLIGGEAEIRTLGGVAPSTVFKTAALNHSATSPAAPSYLYDRLVIVK